MRARKAKAGKATTGRPRVEVRRESMVNLKGVPAFKTWLDEFAAECNLTMADTIGQALAHYAEHRGFRAPPRR